MIKPLQRTALLFFACALAACTKPSEPEVTPARQGSGEAAEAGDDASARELVVYSGRSEQMVGPVVEAFEAETGIDVRVNYAGSAQLAATIVEEGANSPADVFFAQDSSSLGVLVDAGRLVPLGEDVTARVPAHFRSADGKWVGTSGRARVVTYNTSTVTPDQLPASVDGFLEPRWRGRIGWAPENGSFKSFLAAMVQTRGEEATRTWVQGMLANDAKPFPSNTPGVVAVAAGEIDAMITNHYYLYRVVAEQGADTPIANHYFRNGAAESLVNIAGVGILDSAPNADSAARFAAYLLSESAQQHFAQENAEFPVIEGVATPQELPAIRTLAPPTLDLGALSDLATVEQILQETGAL